MAGKIRRVPAQPIGPAQDKVRRLHISGFRSIEDASIQFGDVTILIGANGAGKSNLIGFLQMLSYMMSENLSLYVNEHRGANSILHYGAEHTAQLTGEIEFQSPWANIYIYRFGLSHTMGDRLLFAYELVLQQARDEVAQMVTTLPTQGFKSAVPLLAQTSSNDFEKQICQLFQIRMSELKVFHFHNTSATAAIRGYQNMTENRFLLAQGGNLAVILYRLQKDHSAHYRRIVEEMRDVLPSFLDFVLEPDPARGGQQIELRWRSRYSTATLGPEQLSDGSIRAAALLTLLLQPDELKPGIIVIDEPELGLHPFAVSQIARIANEAAIDSQLIISTQSSRFISEFEPEQVVVVEAREGSSEFRHLDGADLSSWLAEYDLGTLMEMNVTGGAPRMIELTVLCEGPTEVGFVSSVLAPYLRPRGIYCKPVGLTHGNFGVVSWDTLYKAIKGSIGNARAHKFTTCMLDLYALPDYPGQSSSASNPLEKVQNIERALRGEIPNPQWLPYIQLHEFEALLFVDLEAIGRALSRYDLSLGIAGLRKDVIGFQPEEIDEGKDTAPSKRILKFIPQYSKAQIGPRAAESIGLPKLRAACPHFNEWIEMLERLNEGASYITDVEIDNPPPA